MSEKKNSLLWQDTAIIPGLNLTEEQIRNMEKNPFNKWAYIDLLLLFLGSPAIAIVACFGMIIISALFKAVSGSEIFNDDDFGTVGIVTILVSFLAAFVFFLVKLISDVKKRNLFDRVRLLASDENRSGPDGSISAGKTARAAEPLRAPGEPKTKIDEIADAFYNGDTDLALKDTAFRAQKRDYSVVGGRDALDEIVKDFTEAQNKRYLDYCFGAMAADKAFMKEMIYEAGDLTVINMSAEEVRAAQKNPFAKDLIRAAVIFGIGLVFVAAGALITTRLPQAAGLGKTIAASGPVMGSVAVGSLSFGLIRFFKFRKLKKQYDARAAENKAPAQE